MLDPVRNRGADRGAIFHDDFGFWHGYSKLLGPPGMYFFAPASNSLVETRASAAIFRSSGVSPNGSPKLRPPALSVYSGSPPPLRRLPLSPLTLPKAANPTTSFPPR